MYLINFIKVQEAIWEAMNTITKYPVLDYVEFDSINPPIIRLGNLYFDDNSVKNNEGIKVQQYINIYSPKEMKNCNGIIGLFIKVYFI